MCRNVFFICFAPRNTPPRVSPLRCRLNIVTRHCCSLSNTHTIIITCWRAHPHATGEMRSPVVRNRFGRRTRDGSSSSSSMGDQKEKASTSGSFMTVALVVYVFIILGCIVSFQSPTGPATSAKPAENGRTTAVPTSTSEWCDNSTAPTTEPCPSDHVRTAKRTTPTPTPSVIPVTNSTHPHVNDVEDNSMECEWAPLTPSIITRIVSAKYTPPLHAPPSSSNLPDWVRSRHTTPHSTASKCAERA
jgi:hypothetical protein